MKSVPRCQTILTRSPHLTPVARRFVSRVVGSALALALAFPSPVLAQEARVQAAVHFRQGQALYKQGAYLDAASHFEEASRLAPHAVAAYSAGLAWQQAGRLPEAAGDYRMALDLKAEGDIARDASFRLQGLQRHLGELLLTGPVGQRVSIGHVRNGAVPLRLYLVPGPYVLSVSFEDQAWVQPVTVIANERRTMDLSVPPPPPSVAPLAPPSAPPPLLRPVTSTRRIAGVVTLGGAALIAGGAAWVGSSALSARKTYFDSGRTDTVAWKRASNDRALCNVLWGASALAAVVGVTLVAWKLPSAAPATEGTVLRAHLSVTGSSVQLGGVFP